MSCSAAAGSIASESIHRGELTRFLARPRWQKHSFTGPLRDALLRRESKRGKFLFLIDATLVSQAGKKTQNTYSTGNRGRSPAKGRRYNKKKVVSKRVHNFTFGLLITPSGIRIPMEIPHYSEEYCREQGIEHQTTAESAAQMIRTLPLPADAEVVVLGDTAYESRVVCEACQERGYTWVFPANPERVYEGSNGQRLKLRSRLKDWASLSLETVQASSVHGEIRLLPAAFQVAYRAETETARVLRLSGEAGGAPRGLRANRFFDNETRLAVSDSRRRQNPDDQRLGPESA